MLFHITEKSKEDIDLKWLISIRQQQYNESSAFLDTLLYFVTGRFATLKQEKTSNILLTTAVNQFLLSPHKVFLLMGAAGSGKTFFCHTMIKEHHQQTPYIFIYISLTQIANCQEPFLEALLERKYELSQEHILWLKQQDNVVFIFDGYGEQGPLVNLFVTQKLIQWRAKIIITCRDQYLTQCTDPTLYFTPYIHQKQQNRHLIQYRLVLFNENQIFQYVQHSFLSSSTTLKIYQTIQSDPLLSQLAGSPLWLRFIVEVLSTEMKSIENQAVLVHQLVTRWFAWQETKYKELGLLGKEETIQLDCWAYCKALAQYFKEIGQLSLFYRPVSQLFTKTSEDALSKLFTPSILRLVLLRRACPFQEINPHHYVFMANEFVDYFIKYDVQYELKELQQIQSPTEYCNRPLSIRSLSSQHSLEKHFLNRKLMTHDAIMMQWIADRAIENKTFRAFLFFLIYASKKNKHLWKASANAITALNYARVNLSGLNLEDTCLQGADLTKALLHATDMSHSNLSGARLFQAYLQNANLTEAILSNIYYGQEPYLEQVDGIISTSNLIKCVYSPDGKLIAGYTHNEYIYIWSNETNEILHYFGSRRLETQAVTVGRNYPVLFSPDGKQLVIEYQEKEYVIIEVDSGKIIKRISQKKFQGYFEDLLFSPDGKLLVVLHSKKRVAIYDVNTNVEVMSLKPPKPGCTWSWKLNLSKYTSKIACFYMAQGGYKTTGLYRAGFGEKITSLYVWDIREQQHQILQLQLHGYNNFCFSNSGEFVAVAKEEDNAIEVWTVETQQCLCSFKEHSSQITSLVFNSQNTLLASSSKDCTIRVWDLFANNCYAVFYTHDKPAAGLDFHPDGSILLSVSEEESIARRWPLNQKGNQLATTPKQMMSRNQLVAINFKNSQEKQAWLSTDKENVTLYNATKKIKLMTVPLKALKKYMDLEYYACCFSTGGKLYAHLARSSPIEVWDIKQKKCLTTFTSDKLIKTSAIALSPDGKMLAVSGTASRNGKNIIEFWDISLSKLLQTVSIPFAFITILGDPYVSSIAFSPDGKTLVSACFDGNILQWSMKNFGYTTLNSGLGFISLIRNTDKAGMQAIMDINFDDEGNYLIVTRASGTIELWNFIHKKIEFVTKTQPGKTLTKLIAHKTQLINISPTGSKLTWRRQKTSFGELFVLMSDVPSDIGLCFNNTNINDAIGLSKKDIVFLQQQGAIGKPSNQRSYSADVDSQTLIGVGEPKPVVEAKNVFSMIMSTLPLSYESWVASILRYPNEYKPDYTILVLEGINAFGQGIFIKLRLKVDQNEPNLAIILIDSYSNIEKINIEEIFRQCIVKQCEFYYLSWNISRIQALSLWEDAKVDQRKTIHYHILRESMSTKSFENNNQEKAHIHNRFSWAREKLHNLKDSNINLPEEYTDFIGEKNNFNSNPKLDSKNRCHLM